MNPTEFDASNDGCFVQTPVGPEDQDHNAFGPPAELLAEHKFTLCDTLAPPAARCNSGTAALIDATLTEHGLNRRQTMFGGHTGESYATLAKACGNGLVPRGTRAARLAEYRAQLAIVKPSGFSNFGIHAGQVTGDNLQEVAAMYRVLAGECASAGVQLILETACTPPTLMADLFSEIGRDDVLFSLDPANVRAYRQGSELELLLAVHSVIGVDRIRVHAKDFLQTNHPSGRRFKAAEHGWLGGEMRAVGHGTINFKTLAAQFLEWGTCYPWIHEHEPIGADGAPNKAAQMDEIVAGREYLRDKVYSQII